MAETETVLELQDVCLKSGKRYLLNHLNWTIKKGEHWLVFGMNGCGKTTLLSTIAGFQSPSSGTVTIMGEQYTRDNIFALRKRVGFISSSFFDRYYSTEEVLQIVLSGLTGTLNIDDSIKDEDVRYAKALLRELRMGDKMYRPFQVLSKGERQCVLIARALVSRPDILVLDEPGTGLDVYAREHMMNTVRDLAENGDVTVIYVTHYPEEVQPFLGKTMLMRNGRAFAMGDTETTFTGEKCSALLNESLLIHRSDTGRYEMHIQAPSSLAELCYGKRGDRDV